MRRFEYQKGSSSKFWEVEAVGNELHLRWGRIGAAGQKKAKSLADSKSAQAERDKLIQAKTAKGYEEVGVAKASTGRATKKATPKKAAKKATPKKAAKKAAPKRAAKNAAATKTTKQTTKKNRGQKQTPGAARLGAQLLTPRIDSLRYVGYLKPLERTPSAVKKAPPGVRAGARKKGEAILAGASRAAAGPLFKYIDDPALATRLIEDPELDIGNAEYHADGLVDALGAGAMQPLLALEKRIYFTQPIALAIARIRSVEAARYFADNLDNRDNRGLARDYLEHVPEFAIFVLARSKKALFRSMLAVLVQREPAIVEAVLPALGDAERAVVVGLRDQGLVNVPDAKPRQCPAVLAQPPWLQRAKRPPSASNVMVSLDIRQRPASLRWRDGQREEWRTSGDWVPVRTPRGNASARKRLETSSRLVARGKKGKMMLHHVLSADDDVALEVWNATTAAHWEWAPLNLVKQLVARTGLASLKGVAAFTQKNVANGAELLGRFDATGAAPIMGKALLASSEKSRRSARAWLDAFPETAATAFIPVALGPSIEPTEHVAATTALRYLALKGNDAVVLRVAKGYGAKARAAVATLLAWDPLDDFPEELPTLPSWFDPTALPRPLLAGGKRALPVDSVTHLATMLAFSPVDPPYAGIAQVESACDPDSLFLFAWGLFEAWLGADGKGKTDWAMMSLAHFGGDEAARRLTPLIRKWPGDSLHSRAQRGLDLLAAIGTDIALMHLHGISQKLKYKALKARAMEKVSEIAEARGMTADDLADRLVPDFDLDEDGRMELDFGARRFHVGFDENLSPFVTDEERNRLEALPKPGKADDAAAARLATKTFKALKKDVRTVAKAQIGRLELAMCSGRRWPMDVFSMFFASHPLMRHLVSRLVWGSYELDDTLLGTFRVAEDGSFADHRDEEVTLAKDAVVGLPHPLLLDEPTLAAWGQVFGDYELLQPFDQLSRVTHVPTKAEKKARRLSRQEGKKVPTGRLRGLVSRGWRKGGPQDGGGIYEMEKPIPGHTHRIVLHFGPGIFAGDASFEEAEQVLGELHTQRSGTWDTKGRSKIGELPPVVFSEMVSDLERLWA